MGKNKRNIHNNDFEIEHDENFSFIAGYTSGGFPYGNMWEGNDEELEEMEDVFE